MKIAIVKLRSDHGQTEPLQRTLRMMGLKTTNHCIIVEDTSAVKGMIAKVLQYVTFGPVTDDIAKQVLDKKGALKPPKKGYGHIKLPFTKKGGYGDRKEKINDLLKRMLW